MYIHQDNYRYVNKFIVAGSYMIPLVLSKPISLLSLFLNFYWEIKDFEDIIKNHTMAHPLCRTQMQPHVSQAEEDTRRLDAQRTEMGSCQGNMSTRKIKMSAKQYLDATWED